MQIVDLNPLASLGIDSYPSIQILLDIRRLDILEIRATLYLDYHEGDRYLKRVYWVIVCGPMIFTKNKTWVQECSKKTENFRDKIAFDSIDDAIAFTKENWKLITK
jgi:hypothetical protein